MRIGEAQRRNRASVDSVRRESCAVRASVPPHRRRVASPARICARIDASHPPEWVIRAVTDALCAQRSE